MGVFDKGDTSIGSQCNHDITHNWKEVVQGVNDAMFCGKVAYVSLSANQSFILTRTGRFDENGKAKSLEWKGSCQKGVCYQCAVVPIPSIPFSQCGDGRSCRWDGKYAISPSGMLSWSYFFLQPMEITFYAVLTAGAIFFRTEVLS